MESDKLGILITAIGVVYNDLEVVRSEGTGSLMAHAIEIMPRVRQCNTTGVKSLFSTTI